MPLNLICDTWIPVLDKGGGRHVIAPWQMADDRFLRPDWPRADLNIACLELLIGLVFLADPPHDPADWRARRAPKPERLRSALEDFSPAFNLTGEGPLFLQDIEPLAGDPNPPDMLFIDSAGANAGKNNADLMVHRGRYVALAPAFAAMALFTFQAHAPAGGAGHRTSMRGGGPLLTLVDPGQGLWALIWANVPHGLRGEKSALPWMRETRGSDKGLETLPPVGGPFGVEAFFGMPRRLRLVETDGQISGVVQKPYGTNYALWMHPLTPYYRQKPGEAALPVHPRPGTFGYRHWLGVLAEKPGNDGLRERAHVLKLWGDRRKAMQVEGSVLVAGWAMENMKPRDFTFSVQPVVELEEDANLMLIGLVEAAEQAALALRNALEPLMAGGEAREGEREAFYTATEAAFHSRFAALKAGQTLADVAAAWLADLRQQALAQFDALALPGLDLRETDIVQRIVQARRDLQGSFAGLGKYGGAMYGALGLHRPAKRGKAA